MPGMEIAPEIVPIDHLCRGRYDHICDSLFTFSVIAPAGPMFTKRIIPCLDVDRGRVVKGTNFVGLRDAGDPVEVARRYDEQARG